MKAAEAQFEMRGLATREANLLSHYLAAGAIDEMHGRTGDALHNVVARFITRLRQVYKEMLHQPSRIRAAEGEMSPLAIDVSVRHLRFDPSALSEWLVQPPFARFSYPNCRQSFSVRGKTLKRLPRLSMSVTDHSAIIIDLH